MKIFHKATRLTLKEYLKSSSIHGFKYLACEKLKDRLGWISIIVMSFLMAILLAHRSQSRFKISPTFLAMRDEELQDDLFAAMSVSVCPPTPISNLAARQVINNIYMATEDMMSMLPSPKEASKSCPEPGGVPREPRTNERDAMKYLYSFEDRYISFLVPRFSAILTNEMRMYNKSLTNKLTNTWNNTIDDIYFKCSDLFVRCQMEQTTINCEDLFKLTATATGFCCTYSSREKARMKKSNGVNARSGLRLIVQLTPEMVDNEILSDTNHKIIIEEDNEFLGLHEFSAPLKLGYENVIEVTSTEHLFSEDIIPLDYEYRGCVIPYERPNTEWNESYSHRNCYYRCGTAYLYDQCKCYSLSNPYRIAEEDLCDNTNLDCLLRTGDLVNAEYFDNCNCPFTCSFNDTTMDITTLRLNALVGITDSFYHNVNKSTMTVVYVKSGRKGRSRIIFTKPVWKFMADMGGICSLFVGWSVLCVIELVYFSTLRLTVNYITLRRSI